VSGRRALACDHGRLPLKLLAPMLPLSLDTFAVSAALGVAGASGRERWRLSLLTSAFEMVMPIAGFAAGGASAWTSSRSGS